MTESLARWAFVRSVSKSFGPDPRLAVLAGDETTIARVEGRQRLGAGWVSHLLQETTVALWHDPGTSRLLANATARHTERRQALLAALADRGIDATGRTGLNVWVRVADERGTIGHLLADGWLVAGGERFRIASPPALRVTTAALEPADAAPHRLAVVQAPDRSAMLLVDAQNRALAAIRDPGAPALDAGHQGDPVVLVERLVASALVER